jgi:4-amino-4-deoxy-L-arabinose transferase-like glycosyltransferase
MKTKLVLILIILLIVAHLALVIPAISHPERFRVTDSDQYVELAGNFLKTGHYIGVLFSGSDMYRPPVYPLFLAFAMLVFSDVRWASLLQILLTFVNCGLLYRIGLDLKCKPAGYAAVVIYLLSINMAFESLNIMAETLTSFWLLLAVWTVLRFWLSEKKRWLLLSGTALGLGALTRPILYPLFFIWILFLAIAWTWQQRKLVFQKETLQKLAVFAAGGLLLTLVWQVRNYSLYRDFSISDIGSGTFQNWIVAGSLANVNQISRNDAAALIAAAPDPNAFMVEFIKAHPGAFVKDQVRGIILTILSVDYPTWAYDLTGNLPASTGVVANLSFDVSKLFAQMRSGNSWILVGLGAVGYDLGLYALGIFASWRILARQRGKGIFVLVLLVLITLAYMFVAPLAQGSGRFRIPIEPTLALLAGLAFCIPASKGDGSLLPRSGSGLL